MSDSLNRVKEVIDKVRYIQKEADKKDKKASQYLTESCNKISKREHQRLNVIVDRKTGELLSKPVCSYRYYSQLMQNYRNAIKALGFKHHSIKRSVKAFLRKYAAQKEDLYKMLDPSLPIEKLRENMIFLRANTVTGSHFHRDLLKLRIEHYAYYSFEAKSAIKNWILNDDKKQLNQKLHTQILVNPEWVRNLTYALLTKSEPSISDLCIGIALASGRRLTEIMKTATLKAVDDNTLLFSGQLKTKNRYLFEKIAPYEIPSMIDAQIVVTALNRLRAKTQNIALKYHNVFGEVIKSEIKDGDIKDCDHNRAVHKKYESIINRAVRSVLQNGHFSLKDCRALYTEVTYDDHAKEGEARSAYRHRVLGHSLIETQLHYEAFRLDSSVKRVTLVKQDHHERINEKQQSLVDYLSKADADVLSYARAPKIAVMHKWLKSEVSHGLQLEKITPSYIRRHCIFEGKQLDLNTIKKYIREFIELDQYLLQKPNHSKKDVIPVGMNTLPA